jgi:transposase-like protein
VSSGEDAWRAWERLTRWLSAASSGEAAVNALEDIGAVRRLLDQAELNAVRTARQHGKSWAEIATRLGVSRQSAWERWRDVDEERAKPAPLEQAETGREESLIDEVLSRRARGLRRRSTVVVPNVVGMTWDVARDILRRKDLFGVNADEDPVPWSTAVVTDQSPESGAKVAVGSRVLLWVERGDGGAGVREPRRPKPTPGHGREWRPEPSDEAVG